MNILKKYNNKSEKIKKSLIEGLYKRQDIKKE
jgi:hypothetical protein